MSHTIEEGDENAKTVEEELPLKFKNFGNKTIKINTIDATSSNNNATVFSPHKSSSMRSLREDLARLSV